MVSSRLFSYNTFPFGCMCVTVDAIWSHRWRFIFVQVCVFFTWIVCLVNWAQEKEPSKWTFFCPNKLYTNWQFIQTYNLQSYLHFEAETFNWQPQKKAKRHYRSMIRVSDAPSNKKQKFKLNWFEYTKKMFIISFI